MQKFLKQFANPTTKYRPLPFWSWNDRLDPELLRWQIREMERVGLGGYFMHARGGLETEYLGEDWMNCVTQCIDEGDSQELESWLYDESGWPSGFAGGLVTAHGDDYHGRWLTLEEYHLDMSDKDSAGILGTYVITDDNKYTRISFTEAKAHSSVGARVILIKHHANRDYIDVLNFEAVRLFIDYTHEKYRERFADDFGKGMKGFFTDEPRLSGSVEKDVPWSYVIPLEFQARYGYAILDYLPALFLSSDGCEKVRYDFWHLVSDLFVNSFMKQINDWCTSHDIVLTGHAMMEESIFTQMTSTSGVMPFYEHMGMPGIDWLRRTISSPIVPKQVASVASQLGKPFVLTESFALSGWDVSFEELKWITEWQYVNGVNRMCQHLQGYTIRGLRKRDYPPSLFIQQSWWDEYKNFNDYLARLGVMLSTGEQVVDLLVLHPVQSGWIAYDGTKNENINKLDDDFTALAEMLSGLHVDYHLGDETIMQNHGLVQGDRLQVGERTYRVVVLPSMIGLHKNTLRLLQQFSKNGGLVISAGEFPTHCGGEVSEELGRLRTDVVHCGLDRDNLSRVLDEHELARISITQAGSEVTDIHYHQRNLGDSQLYFLVNHSTEDDYETEINIPGIGRVERLMAETGEVQEIPFSHEANTTIVELSFAASQSYILLFTKEQVECPKQVPQKITSVSLGDTFNIVDMDMNSLTLDQCQYRIDGGAWQEPLPIIHLMDKLLNMRRSCDLEMMFTFAVDTQSAQIESLYLVLEDASQVHLEVNGTQVEYSDQGWWKDTSFKKVDIKSLVKQGQNEIIISRHFYQSPKVYHVLFGEDVYETERNQLTYDVELESMYLVGDFGVVTRSEVRYGQRKASFTQGPFVIVEKPTTVQQGDLSYQGLLFFAGKISVAQKIQIDPKDDARIILQMQKPHAPVAKLYVNDALVKILMWAPYDIDITDYVIDGENTIMIELFASNRNLLGPHHHINGELYNVGPESFSGKWSWVEKKGETETTTPEIRQKNYWQDDYCFVKFGLAKEE